MRTIEEIKDKIAEKLGYTDYKAFRDMSYEGTIIETLFIEECMKEAQKEVLNALDAWDDDLSDSRRTRKVIEDLRKEIDQND